jgi:hypothetical protein
MDDRTSKDEVACSRKQVQKQVKERGPSRDQRVVAGWPRRIRGSSRT